MSLGEEDRVRVAVVRAAARPLPMGLGLLAAWLVAGGGVLTATLGATAGYLAGVLGVLVVRPDVRRTLPPGEAPPALPGGQERRTPPARRPLPPELRGRFQELHKRVQGMLGAWPVDTVVPLEKAHLARVPEAFRDLAHLWLRMDAADPGRAEVEGRMTRLEEQVGRLRTSWSLLVGREGDRSDVLAQLERTGDELEALLEVR